MLIPSLPAITLTLPAGLDSELEPRRDTPVDPGHEPQRISDEVDFAGAII
jgi:hypothetical protein